MIGYKTRSTRASFNLPEDDEQQKMAKVVLIEKKFSHHCTRVVGLHEGRERRRHAGWAGKEKVGKEKGGTEKRRLGKGGCRRLFISLHIYHCFQHVGYDTKNIDWFVCDIWELLGYFSFTDKRAKDGERHGDWEFPAPVTAVVFIDFIERFHFLYLRPR